MKLTFCNGSPRGRSSNSRMIIHWTMKGFSSETQTICEQYELRKQTDLSPIHHSIQKNDLTIFVFPLYTDAMPGIVKRFFDSLVNQPASTNGSKFLFIIHSGFPEAHHCRGLERYLKRLTTLLKGHYVGTVIKGGSEGFRLMPPWMTRKTSKIMAQIASELEKTGNLDLSLTAKLAKPEHLTGFRLFWYKVMKKLGLSNIYWNSMLKKNGALKNRFDAPYSEIHWDQ